MTDPSLDKAYALESPEQAKELYEDWAATYDTSFGEAHGYVAPREIARIYKENCNGDEPILDVGAGTGLVAEHLDGLVVDAFDLSPQMLEVARAKGLYRSCKVGDLLQPLDLRDKSYGGVVTAGTFTHGHVGPECLPELLRVVRPGGVFVCGTVPAVFDGMKFGSTLALLMAHGRISGIMYHDIPIYEGAEHDHAGDRGLVFVFRCMR